MEYKYPIETHNSVGFKDISDFTMNKSSPYFSVINDFNKSEYLNCTYDELKNLLGNPVKLKSSFMYPNSTKKAKKNRYIHQNLFIVKEMMFCLSDVVWFVNLTDYKYKGRKIPDWFVIRNFGNGMNMERFLKKDSERYWYVDRSIPTSFENKLELLKDRYSRYSCDSRTYDNGYGASSIWLDDIIKNLDAFGVSAYSPVLPKDNTHWLISKWVWHSDQTYRDMNDTKQILNYYLEENKT